jgi:hypothetical protein
MDLTYGSEYERFRGEVRAFLAHPARANQPHPPFGASRHVCFHRSPRLGNLREDTSRSTNSETLSTALRLLDDKRKFAGMTGLVGPTRTKKDVIHSCARVGEIDRHTEPIF